MLISDGLISYYRCEEASGDLLDAQSSNTLTDNGSVGTGTGKVGSCRDLEFTSTQFFSGNISAFKFGDQDFTIVLWVKPETLTNFPGIMGRSVNTSGSYSYHLFYSDSVTRFRWTVSPNGTALVFVDSASAGVPSSGNWYMIAVHHDSVNNDIAISVNGGAWDAVDHAGGVNSLGPGSFTIGRGLVPGSASNPFDGLIDEVGVWGRCLSLTELSWLYNAGSGRSYSDITSVVSGPVTPSYVDFPRLRRRTDVMYPEM